MSSVASITHLTGYSNFSIEERQAYLLISKWSQYIFTDGRYSEVIARDAKNFELVQISTIKPFVQELERLIGEEKIKTLGIEEDDLRVSEHKKIKQVIKSLKHINLKESRVIKTSDEIEKISGVKCIQKIPNLGEVA